MIAATMSEFRKNMRKYLDSVNNNLETLIINRGKNKGVVMMSLEEYNSLQATHHELTSKANIKRIDSAIKNFADKNSFEKTLLDE